MGRSGFCARRARAARHPGYGRTGYCPRAPPAALRWADPVFARAARAPRDIPVMGEPGIARARRLPPSDGQIRFLRARARAPRDRVLPARAACCLEIIRFLPRRAARTYYGRTGVFSRAPPAAFRWADPVFARAARAPRDIPVTGYCPRAPPAALRWARCRFCARAARLKMRRHPVMGEPGIARAPPAALRWADLVFCARCARAARHPGYGRTGYCPRAPPAALL